MSVDAQMPQRAEKRSPRSTGRNPGGEVAARRRRTTPVGCGKVGIMRCTPSRSGALPRRSCGALPDWALCLELAFREQLVLRLARLRDAFPPLGKRRLREPESLG